MSFKAGDIYIIYLFTAQMIGLSRSDKSDVWHDTPGNDWVPQLGEDGSV